MVEGGEAELANEIRVAFPEVLAVVLEIIVDGPEVQQVRPGKEMQEVVVRRKPQAVWVAQAVGVAWEVLVVLESPTFLESAVLA